jgi:hypothetical protein
VCGRERDFVDERFADLEQSLGASLELWLVAAGCSSDTSCPEEAPAGASDGGTGTGRLYASLRPVSSTFSAGGIGF